MTPRVQGYIWQKSVSRKWLAENEFMLAEKTGGEYAIIERPARAHVFVESFCATHSRADALKKAFGGSTRALPQDWQEQLFAAHRTKPLRIGGRLTVASDAADVPSGPTLIIPAAAAFGTGEHATTAMSLRMLERASRGTSGKWRMLDAGTGSGILALAAMRLGAAGVLAIDNDPLAISTARENAERNGISGVKFVVGDVARKARGTFDIIMANLYSELLVTLLGSFRRCLRPGGHIILSGILRNQEPQLTAALAEHRFELHERRRRGKWLALFCSAHKSS